MTEVMGRGESPGTAAASTLLTFLLADVRGYTKYSAERGDQAAAHLSELFLAVCREVVSAHEGEVFGSAGDQALAAFTSAHAANFDRDGMEPEAGGRQADGRPERSRPRL